MKALQISMSGMDVEWQRLQVIAENLANINSTRNEAGEVFRPRRLLTGSEVKFEQLLTARDKQIAPTGVKVLGIETVAGGPRKAFEPTHPHADSDGFVSYPKIDHAGEMTLMIKTSRAYEANLTAMSIARKMYASVLEIGR